MHEYRALSMGSTFFEKISKPDNANIANKNAKKCTQGSPNAFKKSWIHT